MFRLAFDTSIVIAVGVFSGNENTDIDFQAYVNSFKRLDEVAYSRPDVRGAYAIIVDPENPRPDAAWRKKIADASADIRSKSGATSLSNRRRFGSPRSGVTMCCRRCKGSSGNVVARRGAYPRFDSIKRLVGLPRRAKFPNRWNRFIRDSRSDLCSAFLATGRSARAICSCSELRMWHCRDVAAITQ
jgi:hypothetical protein